LRRYYQAKLKAGELAIKMAVESVLAVAIYFLIVMRFHFIPAVKYVAIPLALAAVIVIVGIVGNRKIRSFYFKDKFMTIAVNKRQYTFNLKDIEGLDLLSDFDSLFGYKRVIIRLKNTSRKPALFFTAETARRFVFWLQAKLEDFKEPFVDDLYLFLKEDDDEA
jgi:hypothetical protein